MEQKIAHVNLLHTPSISLHLMAIVVLVTIRSIHLLWLAKFYGSLETP